MGPFHVSVCVTALLILAVCTRIYYILPRSKSFRRPSKSSKHCKLAVFLGSGGHTSEMLALVSSLDFNRYVPRTYIISEGDTLSERKVAMLEAAKAANSESDMAKNGEIYSILTIPRARKVHQSLLTTPPTAIVSLLHCVYYVTIKQYQQTPCPYFADVLVLNGPGTCLTLCLAVYLNKFLGLSAPKMLYVESFARVKTLSVSGKLLHSLVDRFIVQWPQLLKHSGRGEFHGWLI
ncbi:glycosyltransferase family 1 protein [Gymnopus androsaceus JB14]|uniref:UDP-N-acetylglucosamine transferase subunit ALG14 n=1 Tax=Gymnopus androsaceus JB14 TaxID=1447944 RepID=A0A6A4ITX0_9AGAR|nr:glycosyltransferase family 1 protein [Gymnopus androsaceus JB14]